MTSVVERATAVIAELEAGTHPICRGTEEEEDRWAVVRRHDISGNHLGCILLKMPSGLHSSQDASDIVADRDELQHFSQQRKLRWPLPQSRREAFENRFAAIYTRNGMGELSE